MENEFNAGVSLLDSSQSLKKINVENNTNENNVLINAPLYLSTICPIGLKLL